MPYMTKRKLCEYKNLDFKKSSDDTLNGAGFLQVGRKGRIVCDADDCAAAFAYTDLRKTGQTVRVAGATAKRIREAMRDYPAADQLTVVSLLNGLTLTHPAADLDLTTGYVSRGFILSATMFDLRNLRERVRQAIAADCAVIGAEDAA